MIRLDAHTHLGELYGSSKVGDRIITPQLLKVHCNTSLITHVATYYGGDKNCITEFKNICGDITVYPIQWIIDYEQLFHDNIYGIKIHSHRGISKSGLKGLDYSNTRQMNKLLSRLPDNYSVCVHLQGSSSLHNYSRPLTIAKYAYMYPNLKFILCHSGSFGPHSFWPTDRTNVSLMMIAFASELLVRLAIYAARNSDNIYILSSILTGPSHYKTKLLAEYGKFIFGTDYPFNLSTGYNTLQKQESLISRNNPTINILELHKQNIKIILRGI